MRAIGSERMDDEDHIGDRKSEITNRECEGGVFSNLRLAMSRLRDSCWIWRQIDGSHLIAGVIEEGMAHHRISIGHRILRD